ncbi:IST1 homolog [Oryza brachyantha]|uniref:IST1 homolog n=1 Tax=Oryza brachyantha TaxID=4533 RepID=UPI001AD9BDAB|nr:IST1 homolog [Oryza brachyantha]
MLDAFFKGAGGSGGGAFRGAKCKTLLKLTIPRIKLLRNRRELQLRQMRRDIAKLLEAGQEATARIRVEHIIREENMMAAQEILELFCELIAVRLPIIETQKECPIDLKEAISSICFAAPRCADLPELMQVQMMFATKYGKEFVAAATELMPDCGVNRQIIELLSIRAPPVDAKMKLLKEIAEEHEIDWDPEATETEFLKPHEDLLNGPTYFNGSTLPLPKEKHEETLAASATEHPDEDYDESDTGFDSLDLPEVPKAAIRPPSDTPTPDIGTHVQSSQPSSHVQSSQPPSHEFSNVQSSQPASHEFSNVQSSQPASHEFSNVQSSQPASHEFSNPGDLEENPTANAAFMTELKDTKPISTPFSQPTMPISPNEKNQYVPFAPPPFTAPSPIEKYESNPSPSPSPPVKPTDPEMFTRTIDEVTPPPTTTDYLFSKQPEQLHSTSTENIANIDLDDVLSAAQTAAETAERAASAARAAANLAQLRIADLKKNSKAYENYSDGARKEGHPQTEVTQKPVFDHQDSFSSDTQGYVPSHVPQRSPSMEDDPYFSYPNLFSSKP